MIKWLFELACRFRPNSARDVVRGAVQFVAATRTRADDEALWDARDMARQFADDVDELLGLRPSSGVLPS